MEPHPTRTTHKRSSRIITARSIACFLGRVCRITVGQSFLDRYAPHSAFHRSPIRLAAATIYRHLGEPGNQFSQFYSIPTVLTSNIFSPGIYRSRIFPSVEFGNKVFYVLYVVLLPVATLLLIRKLGGNVWFALLSFAMLYNFNTHWGYCDYTLGIPVILFLVLQLVYYTEKPTLLKAVSLSLLLILLFFHTCPTRVLCSMFRPDRRARCLPGQTPETWRRLLILVPVLVLLVHAAMNTDKAQSHAVISKYYRSQYFQTLWERWTELFTLDYSFLASGPFRNRLCRRRLPHPHPAAVHLYHDSPFHEAHWHAGRF